MTRHAPSVALSLLIALVFVGCQQARDTTAEVTPPPAPPDPPAQSPQVEVGGYQITGPYVHENLTAFIVHGRDQVGIKAYLTLQEALEQKKVIVHETGSVNELAIENISADEDVYVQSGDIVKGGRQDRTIATDFVVPPKSGQIPIAAFCVEHGRWSGRGEENAANFGSSGYILSSKDQKLSAKYSNDQSSVWAGVAIQQAKLSGSISGNVNSTTSPSSLQLSLENNNVQTMTDAYVKAFDALVPKNSDAIGYAFAINGKLNSADVYSSASLFKKLWPKLLRASAVEALAEMKKDLKFEPATLADVRASFADAATGKPTERAVTKRVKLITRESEKNVLFECRDESCDVWIHRNYMTRDKDMPRQPNLLGNQRSTPNQQLQQRQLPQQSDPVQNDNSNRGSNAAPNGQ